MRGRRLQWPQSSEYESCGWLRDEGGKKVSGPGRILAAQPSRSKAVAAVIGHEFGDGDLIALRGRCGEGESGVAESEVEQAVAPAGLAVVIEPRRGPGAYPRLGVTQDRGPRYQRALRVVLLVVLAKKTGL